MKRLSYLKNFSILFAFIFSVCICSISFAADFTASTIGNYGDITVMEVTDSYDADNPESHIPRMEIAKEFFKTHPDNYDFIIIYSNFDFKMPHPQVAGFYCGVKNNVQGIGRETFDNSSFYGSEGKLQGTIDMGNIGTVVSDPLDPKFEFTMTILSHELLHRWAAYIDFEKEDGTISDELLGERDLGGNIDPKSHWSFLLDTSGSVLYGNRWQDNGDGTFTSLSGLKYYSPLDLYLMGFNDKSEVPPMLLIENQDIDSGRHTEAGVTIEGTPHYINIDDIIAAEGERIPGPNQAQKTFKLGSILITRPGTFTGDELHGIRNILKNWVMWFSSLTRGKGTVFFDASPIEDIPVNPGISPPSHDPRITPPEIIDGVTWLINNQSDDGSWMDVPRTTERDTSEAVIALKDFSVAEQSHSLGIQWLTDVSSVNADYLSRKIEAFCRSGEDATGLLEELLLRQNSDGGWGSNKDYISNPTDTSFAVRSLVAAGYSDTTVIAPAIEYLKSKQNPDKGWGGDAKESSIRSTANVLYVFRQLKEAYQLDDYIQSGILCLLGDQNPDGGFGDSPSTVYGTATALLILKEFNISYDTINNALNYILNLQSEDGSWYESPYQTALAVSAIWKTMREPDLSITTSDISFTPSTVTSLPADVVVDAVIRNNGLTDVPEVKVAIYDGAVSEANKVGEQAFAIPGKASVTASFTVTITSGTSHRYYVAVDPEDLVKESNESNNTAIKILYLETTYDFNPSVISVLPDTVDILQIVTITSQVRNNGTGDAFNVPLRYYIDDPGGLFDIATVYVDIPAGKTVENEITWKTDRPGENLNLTVYADPFNAFVELSESNNQASTTITVNPLTGPNLAISHQDIEITPSPAHEAGSVTITALIRNDGFSAADNIGVSFYKGVPDQNGVLLGSRTITSLDAGESTGVSIDWTDIAESGERIIYIQVDPQDTIQEINEDDNSAFKTLQILSLPDLVISTNSISFAPSAPKEGDTVSILVTVQNAGEQEAANVRVTASEGGSITGSGIIDLIPGNSQEGITFTYDTTGKTGTHDIIVTVDPDNTILEQSEDNNIASSGFVVQNADLWLSERYISPNGDSIKDSTRFFFRLKIQQTVKILMVSPKGLAVRTFSGPEFANTTGGTVNWDGLDDNGMVVADGQYQIQVLGENSTVLASLPVTVDNNRSPLTEAIGTEYLLKNNLTCMLPDIKEWQWFSDESGIIFHLSHQDPDAPEYTNGIYTMAPDGEDIFRLVPHEWSKNADNNSPYSYSYGGYSNYRSFSLSLNEEKVVFILNKSLKSNSRLLRSQIWTEDRYGENLFNVVSYDYQDEDGQNITYIRLREAYFSPDNSHIIYKLENSQTRHDELCIINSDGTGKVEIPWGESEYYKHIMWSPDSSKIAYARWSYADRAGKIILADLSGNKEEIFEINNEIASVEWLGHSKIIVVERNDQTGPSLYNIWLVDASGQGNHIKVAEGLKEGWYYPSGFKFNVETVKNPNDNNFAFIDNSGEKWSVKICDDQGNCNIVHESPVLGHDGIFVSIDDLRWSHDGKKLAFVDNAYKKIDPCYYEGYLVVIDMATMEKNAFKVSDEQDTCWQPHSYHIQTREDGSWIERGVLHYDSDYETKEMDLTRWLKDNKGCQYINRREYTRKGWFT